MFRFRLWLLTIAMLAMVVSPAVMAGVPGLISYQGMLKNSEGDPVTETVNVTFTIYDDASASDPSNIKWQETHSVSPDDNGLFIVLLGAGSPAVPITDDVFDGPDRWLGIQAEGQSEMTPRTRITSYAYAQRISTVDGATGGAITGDVSIASDLTVDGDLYASGKATIGTGHTNSGAGSFVAGTGNTASGDNSTIGGGANNIASGDQSTIGGGTSNTASELQSTIAGGYAGIAGGESVTIGGGWHNTADGTVATVGGGQENTAHGYFSVIAGGLSNTTNNGNCTIAGGASNEASGLYSAIGGGRADSASAVYAGIMSGYSNRAGDLPGDTAAFVGGGYGNYAKKMFSAICGGKENATGGNFSFVGGGRENRADGDGSVVCGGGLNETNSQFSCIAGGLSNTLDVSAQVSLVFGFSNYINTPYRISFFNGTLGGRLGLNRDDHDGGIGFPIQVGTNTSNGNGSCLTPAGFWLDISSKSKKENYQPFSRSDLFGKISNLEVDTWQYIGYPEKHVGPFAEEFNTAFGTGSYDLDGNFHNEMIAGNDVAGVALAGVKELIQENQELKQAIDKLRTEIESLKASQNTGAK